MEVFPFTAQEWWQVSEATRAVVNTTLADDPVLQASLLEELRRVLADLQDRYGAHPVLLETEADFTDEPFGALELYERAKQAGLANGLPTYSIRIALARLLLEELRQPGRALQELLACRDEVTACADESERQEWSELEGKCARRLAD